MINLKTIFSNESFPLRLKYRTASGRVRVGRILEDLDTIAGIASYKHNIQMERAKKDHKKFDKNDGFEKYPTYNSSS